MVIPDWSLVAHCRKKMEKTNFVEKAEITSDWITFTYLDTGLFQLLHF